MNINSIRLKTQEDKKYYKSIVENAEHTTIDIDEKELSFELTGEFIAPGAIMRYESHVANSYADLVAKQLAFSRAADELVRAIETVVRENSILSAKKRNRARMDKLKIDSMSSKRRLTQQYHEQMQYMELMKRARQMGLDTKLLQHSNMPAPSAPPPIAIQATFEEEAFHEYQESLNHNHQD